MVPTKLVPIGIASRAACTPAEAIGRLGGSVSDGDKATANVAFPNDAVQVYVEEGEVCLPSFDVGGASWHAMLGLQGWQEGGLLGAIVASLKVSLCCQL